MTIELTVNGQPQHREVPGHLTLLEFLRDHLGLTGTKYGCGLGECGACTVLLNGRAVCACLTLVAKCQGAAVVTIEGLGGPNDLHPIQRAFWERGAFQCGFCTPGMIMSTKALLDQNPAPTEEEIRLGLTGNLCRCTGYVKIVEAVREAAVKLGRP